MVFVFKISLYFQRNIASYGWHVSDAPRNRILQLSDSSTLGPRVMPVMRKHYNRFPVAQYAKARKSLREELAREKASLSQLSTEVKTLQRKAQRLDNKVFNSRVRFLLTWNSYDCHPLPIVLCSERVLKGILRISLVDRLVFLIFTLLSSIYHLSGLYFNTNRPHFVTWSRKKFSSDNNNANGRAGEEKSVFDQYCKHCCLWNRSRWPEKPDWRYKSKLVTASNLLFGI